MYINDLSVSKPTTEYFYILYFRDHDFDRNKQIDGLETMALLQPLFHAESVSSHKNAKKKKPISKDKLRHIIGNKDLETAILSKHDPNLYNSHIQLVYLRGWL